MRSMTKILNLLHYPHFNGPANTCVQIDEPLQAAGVFPTTVIPQGATALEEMAVRTGISYVTSDISRLRNSYNPVVQMNAFLGLTKTVSKIRKIIRNLEIDVVVIQGMENPHGAIAARLEGKKVVGQILGLGIPAYARRVISLWSRAICDVAMMPGRTLHDHFPWFLKHEDCVFFIPPVDHNKYFFSQKSRSLANRVGIDTSKPVVGTIGNVNPAKDFITFLASASEVLRSLPGTQFIVKGNVPISQTSYFDALLSYCQKLGLRRGRDIFFIQDSDDSVEIISLMDVYVQPSKGEGISTALLEAMSMERPVIATKVGSTEDVIKDGLNGLLIPPEDPHYSSKQILHLLRYPDKSLALGRNARQFVVGNASIQSCADAHIRAIQMACSVKTK